MSGSTDRLRPSPTFVLCAVAVVLAAAPAAWAAGLITGDDIQNSSITGKDLKDGSVGPSDLSRTARAALEGEKGDIGATGKTGATGAEGPAGPPGAPGAGGARGPSGPAGPAGADGADGKDALALWARVDGTPPATAATVRSASSPAPAVQIVGSGAGRLYHLTFDRDISACAAAVTRRSAVASSDPDALLSDADADAGGTAYTFAAPGSHVLSVRLLTPAGAGTLGSFSVVLRCP